MLLSCQQCRGFCRRRRLASLRCNASVALALKLYLEIECHRDTLKSATKRLMKMLERKRVEANCVRMVQGTARRHVFVTPCYRFRGIECAL